MNTCKNCGAEYNGIKCPYCGMPVNYVLQKEERSIGSSSDMSNQNYYINDDMLTKNLDFIPPEGLVNIGKMYANGIGVEKNEVKAFECYEKAAKNACPEGMFYYAEALRYGKGVTIDVEKAENYYVEAFRLGHQGAALALKEMNPERYENISLSSESDLEKLVGKVMPFCVEILCYSADNVMTQQGSGFILSNRIVITNAHVVRVGDSFKKTCHKIVAKVKNNGEYVRYELITKAVDDKEDVAVCESNIPIITPDSDYPRFLKEKHEPGQKVFTIGNGKGEGLGVSSGIISKYEKKSRRHNNRDIIQTDISINSGNSGGALFDMDGNIVGMMAFVIKNDNNTDAYGMSFAVTADTIEKTLRCCGISL